MNANRRPTPRSGERRAIPDAYDEADWVDWDHWQTVEEIQDFLKLSSWLWRWSRPAPISSSWVCRFPIPLPMGQ